MHSIPAKFGQAAATVSSCIPSTGTLLVPCIGTQQLVYDAVAVILILQLCEASLPTLDPVCMQLQDVSLCIVCFWLCRQDL